MKTGDCLFALCIVLCKLHMADEISYMRSKNQPCPRFIDENSWSVTHANRLKCIECKSYYRGIFSFDSLRTHYYLRLPLKLRISLAQRKSSTFQDISSVGFRIIQNWYGLWYGDVSTEKELLHRWFTSSLCSVLRLLYVICDGSTAFSVQVVIPFSNF